MSMDPLIDFDAQEQALLQQQARVKAMRAAAGLPVEAPGVEGGWTSAVTGTRIAGRQLKTPTMALANPILNTIGADLGEHFTNQRRADLTNAEQDNAQAAIEGLPAAPTAGDYQRLNRNPLTRALSAKAVEDRLIAAPIRADAERVALGKALRDAQEKALDRQNALTVAGIRAQGGGSWQDTGLVDARGAKIYMNMKSNDKKSAGSIPEGDTIVPGIVGQTPAAGVPAGGVMDGARPAPTPMSATTVDDTVVSANRSTTLKNIKQQFAALNPTGIGTAILNRAPDVAKSGLLGDDARDKQIFWSQFQEEANAQLRAMSGLAVTEGEAKRQSGTMPGPTADPVAFNAWIDRQMQLNDLAAVRKQALSQDTKYRQWDPVRGAVVDTTTGKAVPGTETPAGFAVEVRGTRDSKPTAAPATATRVSPSAQAARDGDAREVLSVELRKNGERAREIQAEMADPSTKPAKVLELQAEMSRNAADREGIERELARASGKKQALPRANPQNGSQPKTLKWGDLP